MKLVRYNDPLSAQLRAFDNWFGQPQSAGLSPLNRLFDLAQGLSARAAAGNIAADLYEDDGSYFARVELPGVKKSDVKVALDERVLSIGYDKVAASDDEKTVSEKRSLTVPDGIDADKVSAKLEDGILTVVLPKAETVKPKEIKVH